MYDAQGWGCGRREFTRAVLTFHFHPTEVQSSPESEKTKIIVGALGFVFGLTILLAGVIMKLRNAKGELVREAVCPRPPALGSTNVHLWSHHLAGGPGPNPRTTHPLLQMWTSTPAQSGTC